jgi:hypothetical protein
MSDEFYIGYEPEMPVALASRIRRLAFGIVALAIVTPVVLLFGQDRFAPGVFEFGRQRTFSGRLVEFPYPALTGPTCRGRRTGWSDRVNTEQQISSAAVTDSSSS